MTEPDDRVRETRADARERARDARSSDAVAWLSAGVALLLCVAAIGLASEVWRDTGASSGSPASEASRVAWFGSLDEAASGSAGEARATSSSASAPDASASEPQVRIETEGRIGRGDTLARALSKQGVEAGVAPVVAGALSPVFNFRYARPGDRFHLTQDAIGEVLAFDYRRSPLEHYTLRREGEELVPARYEPEIERRRARVAGVVSTSLYEAVSSLGEDPELAADFAEIFAWDVDFARNVQPGDEFAILYERRFLATESTVGEEERYLGPGRILAARYSNQDADFEAIYYASEEGRGGYYRPDGSSVQRQFLKAPLSYRRISSGYQPNRLHPILKVRRPHLGIDYAAGRGTPVWAVAAGTVSHVGRAGGLGKAVKVRHRNGYTTYYGHLSRYASGLRVGDPVQQKQVIGYVGSTGLATGPHLHFTLKQHGRHVNPASLDSPAADPLPERLLADFEGVRDARLGELAPSGLQIMTSEAL